MVFPFPRSQQGRTAGALFERLRENRPVVVHAVCFPALTLNHGILLYSGQKTEGGYDFEAYDPNGPSHPIVLRYDRQARRFFLARSEYFRGGWVNVYEVYRGLIY
jgi:hypothetical protein